MFPPVGNTKKPNQQLAPASAVLIFEEYRSQFERIFLRLAVTRGTASGDLCRVSFP